MAKPSSSKKVQRAAQAAAASRGHRERRERGFPLVLGLVMILGVTMVMFARASRAPAIAPFTDDHWHAAYGIYDCNRFIDPLLSQSDPDGIHSHQDGVIHIHPWNSSSTGADARLQVFFEAMGIRVSDDEISGPGIGVLEAGSDCNGEPTVIRVARWALPEGVADDEEMSLQELQEQVSELMELTEEYVDDFDNVRLLEDGEAFTIARIPADADIPQPPIDRLESSIASSAGNRLSSGPTATN